MREMESGLRSHASTVDEKNLASDLVKFKESLIHKQTMTLITTSSNN